MAVSSSYSNLNSKSNNNTVSCSKLHMMHSSVTIAAATVCAIHLYVFNGLLEIGHLWQSPTIPIVITSEFIKLFVNEKYFKLLAQPKHLANAYQRRDTDKIDHLKDFIYTIIVIVVFFCVYVFTCIIFGAAIVQDFHGTVCLSVVLVGLTVLPLCLYLRGSGTLLQLLFCDQFELTSKSQMAYLEYVQTNGMAALFGAWISSVVAPLDWDRDWQKYPIPNICGALLGVVTSNIYWLVSGIGKHIAKKRGKTQRKSN